MKNPRVTKREQNRLDRQIDDIVRRRCSGIAINILDIHQVFEAGYKADVEGRDLEAAIVDTYRLLAQ